VQAACAALPRACANGRRAAPDRAAERVARTGQQAPRQGDAAAEAIEPLLLLLSMRAAAIKANPGRKLAPKCGFTA
jgi:hypothetical protein